jgi:Protein of unknown function (DUF3592)
MKLGRNEWLTYTAVVVLGSLMVAGIGINFLNKDQDLRIHLIRYGERVPGVITDLRGRGGPHMKFQTRDGRDVETNYGHGMDFPERSKLFVGMPVDIVYDPNDPTRAIPAPYPTVLKRDKVSDLGAFLKQILIFGLPIFVLALIFSGLLSAHAKKRR